MEAGDAGAWVLTTPKKGASLPEQCQHSPPYTLHSHVTGPGIVGLLDKGWMDAGAWVLLQL